MKSPKCESENTQRLEVAFQGGTQDISTTSKSVGVGIGSRGRIGFGGGVTKTSGQSQSILAQKATPPARKPYKEPIIIILGGVLFFSIGQVSGIVMGLAAVGISGYLIYSRFQFNSQEWPKLYQHWSESWLCHKCGGIYHQA